jgi:hypothetical protein
MKVSKRRVMAGLAVIPTALVVGTNRIACAQPQGDVIGELASNEGIFVDGKTFKIAKGKAKGDPSAQIARLGAKEIGPGAIVFRYRDKLYIVEGTPATANVQTMKPLQDDWNASYMNSVKDFQDNWSTSYMK